MLCVDGTVSNQLVRALAGLAIWHGCDANELMRSAGISPPLLTNRWSPVTAEQLGSLVKIMVRATDDEMLGLGAAAVPPGTLRMLGYALLGAVDLGRAVARYREFKRALPGMPTIELVKQGPTARLSIDLSIGGQSVGVLIDAALAATHRVMAWATNSRILLQRVEIPHPRIRELEDYDVIFGAPVVRSTARSTLVFPATILASPIVRTQADWDAFLCNATTHILSRRDYAVALSDRVRRMLEQSVTGPWPTADDVAARLAMSPQTMRRKLQQEGVSLSQIRQEVRCQAAITSLVTGQETMAALSYRLGFSEPSAFTRAFRRWTGTSPSTYLSVRRTDTARPLARGEKERDTGGGQYRWHQFDAGFAMNSESPLYP